MYIVIAHYIGLSTRSTHEDRILEIRYRPLYRAVYAVEAVFQFIYNVIAHYIGLSTFTDTSIVTNGWECYRPLYRAVYQF